MTTREAQAQHTRERLIEGMMALMSRMDYERIRIADIAREAGCSVGTFYLYFESKTDIAAGIVRELNARLTEGLEVSAEASVELQFMDYCDRYHATILRDGFNFSRAVQIAMIEGAIGRGESAVERQYDYLTRLIGQGFESGELRQGSVAAGEFADMFLCAISGTLLEWCFSAGDAQVLARGMANVKKLFGLLK